MIIRFYVRFVLLLGVVLSLAIVVSQGIGQRIESIEIAAFPVRDGEHWQGITLGQRDLVVKITDDTLFEEPVWSNDGQLAWSSAIGNHIRILSHGKVSSYPVLEKIYSAMVWSNDGRLAFVAGDAGREKVYVFNSGNIVDLEDVELFLPVWSNSGQLAWTDKNGDIFVWDGLKILKVNSTTMSGNAPIWSDKGHLAWTSSNSDGAWRGLYVWNGEKTIEVQSNELGLFSPAWSPDGCMLSWVETGQDQQSILRVWDGQQIMTITQQQQIFTTIIQAGATVQLWSLDGWLVWQAGSIADSDIYVWNGEEVIQVTDTPVTEVEPTWSNHGYLAWAGSQTSSIYMWDRQTITAINNPLAHFFSPHWLENGTLVFLSERYPNGVRVFKWSPEDKTIVDMSFLGRQARMPLWFSR